MNYSEFSYSSIHDYLDKVLSDIEVPSNIQIKKAKADYWKLWYRHYRKTKRKELKEFTLRLNKEQLKKIDRKRVKYTRSQFLYYAVNFAIDNQLASFDKELFGGVYQSIMRLINLLEDIENEDNPETLKKAYDIVIALEKELSNFKNTTQ